MKAMLHSFLPAHVLQQLIAHTLALCAILRFFQKPINFSARHSELTYERHIFLHASPAEEKSAKLHTQTIQT